MAEKKVMQHWPVILMVLVVALIFLISLISFQVETTEYAVVLRFGKPVSSRDVGPGLNFKLPWETVWRQDNRIQCFEGNIGELEEVFTHDGKNIIVTAYIGWKIAEPEADQLKFMVAVETMDQAKEKLTALLRSSRASVLGKFKFNDLINEDPGKVRIDEVEAKMLEEIRSDARELFGIDVSLVGIKHIGFPESVTTKVIERMQAERESKKQAIISDGKAEAERIRAEADSDSRKLLAEAEGDATRTKADGESKAADYFEAFKEDPELAMFILSLDALKRAIQKDDTLILDTNTPPFDILKKDALQRLNHKAPKPAEDMPQVGEPVPK